MHSVVYKCKQHALILGVCGLLVPPSLMVPSALAQGKKNPLEQEIERILVFARKRAEAIRDIPVSISAMSNEELMKAGVSDITELFALMPSIENNADGSRIANKPAIRGVGSTENASIRAKVTSFIDGIPIVGAQGISSFAGLEQVEVLRGPQGAAFGRSTFGGAINYVTRDADPDSDFEFDLTASLGTDATTNLSLIMSSALIEDKLAIGVTLESKDYGGSDNWVTTSGVQLGGTSDTLGSIKLVYIPTDNIKAKLLYLSQKIDDDHPAVTFANLDQLSPHPLDSDGLCAINGGGNACVILGEIDPVPLVFDFNFDFAANPVLDPGTSIERKRLQGSIEINFDSGLTLTTLGAFTDEKGDTWFDRDAYSDVTTIHVGSNPVSDETYAEIRLASPNKGNFKWLFGASIYDYDYFNTVFANRLAEKIKDLFVESASNIGVFFSLDYHFTDKLSASFDGRYQIDKIGSTYPANHARRAPNDIMADSETKSFQPRLALSYALNEQSNLYVQIARGTNPAGFNANALDPVKLQTAEIENYDLKSFQTYQEEEIFSYELGIKGDLDALALGYSIAAYYLDWSGYVQPVLGNWTPNDGILIQGTTANDYVSRLFLNTGDLDGMGIELEGQWVATDELEFRFSFAYSGLAFKHNACSPIPLDYGVPATSSSPFKCAAVIGGNQPPMLSKYTSALNATYTVPINNDIDGYARIDYQYRSKRYVEQTNTDYLPDYSLVNLRTGVRAQEWSIELYVSNLFDEDSPAGAVRFFDGRMPGRSFNTSIRLRQPRTSGINMTYSFF